MEDSCCNHSKDKKSSTMFSFPYMDDEDYRLLAAVVLILLMVLLGIYELYRWMSTKGSNRNITGFKGYRTDYPEMWKCKYPQSMGKLQSPINIESACCLLVRGKKNELIFSEKYFKVPKGITVLNDGYNVLISACFEDDYPIVRGGPLQGEYRFNLCHFRWGPTDIEGSEHTVDSVRYAMELQVMHIKGDVCYENLQKAVENRAVLFISYFFQVTPMDNPYLGAIVESLESIEEPNQIVHLDGFPLSWIFHPFRKSFYYYQGSLTFPPCTEGVDWIIQPEPLSISSAQLQQFRRLQALDGQMRRNTRPVQKLNSRKIYLYD